MNKRLLGRLRLAAIALFFLITGIGLMFYPQGMLEHMWLSDIDSSAELSSVRAIWAAAIIAIWGCVLLGAIKAKSEYCLLGLITLGLTLCGRTIGYIADGSFPGLTAAIFPTLIALGLMLLALGFMTNTQGVND